MYEGIKQAIHEKRFFSTTREYVNIRRKLVHIKRYQRKKDHIIPNKIIFLTFRGGYDCNAKWICKKLSENPEQCELVWAIKKEMITGEEDFPENVVLTEWGTKDFYRHLCTAGIIVDNGVSTASVKYRKTEGQVLIETWHGSLGIKKFSPKDMKNPVWVENAFKEAGMTDYIISNSRFENEIYREDYWKTNEIWMLGHARNDVLFYDRINRPEYNRIKEKIYKLFGLEEDVRICLYGPTFREKDSAEKYKMPYEALTSALSERFGGKWVIFTRFHSRAIKQVGNIFFDGSVVNASMYPDIQELAAVSQCAISDYSSWITEFILTGRPGFIFATDYSDYEQNSRSLFYPLSDLPFPLSENSEQLIEQVRTFNEESFNIKWEKFMSDKGCIDDGHASERIAGKILELIQKTQSK